MIWLVITGEKGMNPKINILKISLVSVLILIGLLLARTWFEVGEHVADGSRSGYDWNYFLHIVNVPTLWLIGSMCLLFIILIIWIKI